MLYSENMLIFNFAGNNLNVANTKTENAKHQKTELHNFPLRLFCSTFNEDMLTNKYTRLKLRA